MPKTVSGKAIASQVIRSGMSVAANYRESQRSRTKIEFISKLSIALGEAEETALWLELITEYGMFDKGKLSPISKENSEIISILCAMSNSAKRNKNK
jgi:four helix bundle protein